MQPSNKINVELLVSLVSECRELYDQRHSDYKNIDKKELLWQEIADQIGFDVEEVKLKWKSLRDTYMRKKREEDCRSGQAAKNKKQWKYMKVMKFFATSTEFQSVHSNISENTDANEVDDQNDASENEQASTEISVSSPAVMRSRAKKRKQSDMPDFLENYLLSKDARDREKEERNEQRREQKREIKKDDIYFFVHGLVPALKRLSPPQLSSVKLQIQQLLHNAEFGQSSFSVSSPSGHPADPYEL